MRMKKQEGSLPKEREGSLPKKREGRLPKKRDGNLPKGVMRREATRELVCDVRFTHCNVKGKFHATQIESLEEGAFFYDIVKLYEWRLRGGSRRRRLLELNYPEVSSSLNLIELPKDFHIKHNKEQVQKLILEQARRAARGLIQSQVRPHSHIRVGLLSLIRLERPAAIWLNSL